MIIVRLNRMHFVPRMITLNINVGAIKMKYYKTFLLDYEKNKIAQRLPGIFSRRDNVVSENTRMLITVKQFKKKSKI